MSGAFLWRTHQNMINPEWLKKEAALKLNKRHEIGVVSAWRHDEAW